MSKLPEELILEAEEAIQSDMLVSDENLYISGRYYQDAADAWKLIKNSEKNSYKQFASSGGDMTSYGFYKANDGQIYIIEAWINNITYVYLASENTYFLKHALKNDADSDSD